MESLGVYLCENGSLFQPVAMYGGVHPLMAPPIGGPLADPFGFSPTLHPPFVPGAGLHPPGVGRAGPLATTPIQGTPASAVLPPGPLGGRSPVAGVLETVNIWVPNNIVGALIGTKGMHIRNVIRMTGATIRIESSKNEHDGDDSASHEPSPQPHATGGRRDMDGERRVTIVGTDQQQYKVTVCFSECLR